MIYSLKKNIKTSEKYITIELLMFNCNKPKHVNIVNVESSNKQSISKEVETKNDVTLYIERGQAKKSAGWMPWH